VYETVELAARRRGIRPAPGSNVLDSRRTQVVGIFAIGVDLRLQALQLRIAGEVAEDRVGTQSADQLVGILLERRASTLFPHVTGRALPKYRPPRRRFWIGLK